LLAAGELIVPGGYAAGNRGADYVSTAIMPTRQTKRWHTKNVHLKGDLS